MLARLLRVWSEAMLASISWRCRRSFECLDSGIQQRVSQLALGQSDEAVVADAEVFRSRQEMKRHVDFALDLAAQSGLPWGVHIWDSKFHPLSMRVQVERLMVKALYASPSETCNNRFPWSIFPPGERV